MKSFKGKNNFRKLNDICVCKNLYVVRLTGEFLSASVFMSILTNFSEEHPTCYYLSRCKRIKGIRTETKGDGKELIV